MTRLQLALDSDLASAMDVLASVHPYIDIVEIGTPLIYREGMNAVRVVREQYPQLPILADLKIMDAGEEEASIAFSAGANYVTVLGVTQNPTIAGAVKSANGHSGEVVVDMMQVNDLVGRGQDLLKMGCDVLCVHTAFDLQSQETSPYHHLETLRAHISPEHLAIAGGVNLQNLDAILPLSPAIIVVGGAITRAEHPATRAQQLQERIQTYANNP